MYRFAKRMAALVLAGAMMVSAATSAFAGSPTSGNKTADPVVKTAADSKGDVKITSATSSKNTLFVVGLQKGKHVRTINSGAIGSKKYTSITLELFERTKVKKNVISKKAKKFNKAAFKNLGKKCTIIVKKSAMTKKEFNKLKKKLKKGGFKGKIKYKK